MKQWTPEEREELYEQLEMHHGAIPQLRQAQEEMAECIVAINKYIRYNAEPTSKRDLMSELADVKIMVEQVVRIVGVNLEHYEIEKLNRQERRENGQE